MPDLLEPTRTQFWELANGALALGGALGFLIALVLGMAFVRALW